MFFLQTFETWSHGSPRVMFRQVFEKEREIVNFCTTLHEKSRTLGEIMGMQGCYFI